MVFWLLNVIFLVVVHDNMASNYYYKEMTEGAYDIYYGPAGSWGYKEFKSPKYYKPSYKERGDRPGKCIQGEFQCTRPFPIAQTKIFECEIDYQCPRFFKCCKNYCFQHKICQPIDNTEESTTETEVEIFTTVKSTNDFTSSTKSTTYSTESDSTPPSTTCTTDESSSFHTTIRSSTETQGYSSTKAVAPTTRAVSYSTKSDLTQPSSTTQINLDITTTPSNGSTETTSDSQKTLRTRQTLPAKSSESTTRSALYSTMSGLTQQSSNAEITSTKTDIFTIGSIEITSPISLSTQLTSTKTSNLIPQSITSSTKYSSSNSDSTISNSFTTFQSKFPYSSTSPTTTTNIQSESTFIPYSTEGTTTKGRQTTAITYGSTKKSITQEQGGTSIPKDHSSQITSTTDIGSSSEQPSHFTTLEAQSTATTKTPGGRTTIIVSSKEPRTTKDRKVTQTEIPKQSTSTSSNSYSIIPDTTITVKISQSTTFESPKAKSSTFPVKTAGLEELTEPISTTEKTSLKDELVTTAISHESKFDTTPAVSTKFKTVTASTLTSPTIKTSKSVTTPDKKYSITTKLMTGTTGSQATSNKISMPPKSSLNPASTTDQATTEVDFTSHTPFTSISSSHFTTSPIEAKTEFSDMPIIKSSQFPEPSTSKTIQTVTQPPLSGLEQQNTPITDITSDDEDITFSGDYELNTENSEIPYKSTNIVSKASTSFPISTDTSEQSSISKRTIATTLITTPGDITYKSASTMNADIESSTAFSLDNLTSTSQKITSTASQFITDDEDLSFSGDGELELTDENEKLDQSTILILYTQTDVTQATDPDEDFSFSKDSQFKEETLKLLTKTTEILENSKTQRVTTARTADGLKNTESGGFSTSSNQFSTPYTSVASLLTSTVTLTPNEELPLSKDSQSKQGISKLSTQITKTTDNLKNSETQRVSSTAKSTKGLSTDPQNVSTRSMSTPYRLSTQLTSLFTSTIRNTHTEKKTTEISRSTKDISSVQYDVTTPKATKFSSVTSASSPKSIMKETQKSSTSWVIDKSNSYSTVAKTKSTSARSTPIPVYIKDVFMLCYVKDVKEVTGDDLKITSLSEGKYQNLATVTEAVDLKNEKENTQRPAKIATTRLVVEVEN